MKTTGKINIVTLAALLLVLAASVVTARAQTYETSLTNAVFTENFDELLATNCTGAGLPAGWVMAEGVGLPKYGAAIGSTNLTNFTTIVPANFTNYQWINEGGASACTHDISPGGTFGGRINFSDAASSYNNRCIGFRSSNPSWESPTNHFMLGFYNNTGTNILSLAVTNNIKLYGYNETPAQVSFYYSLDGTNWNSASAGNCGPFPNTSGSSNVFFYSTGPIVSNVSFTISGLNITNGRPFYLDWQFVISSANGSYSASIGLDDVGLTATLGTPPPPAGTSVWPTGAGSWNIAADWQGDSLPVSGNDLVFDGPGGAMNNNLGAVSTGTGTVGFMLFSNTASGSYTVSGNAVTVTAGITNASSFLQTFGIPLTLTADEVFNATNGSLSFSGNITNGGNQVIFEGNNNITVSGVVTGSGNLVMSGGGQLALDTANSYGGQTLLNSGTTLLGNVAAIPAGSVVDMGGNATLNLNGVSPTIISLSGGGTVALGANTLTISGGGGSFAGIISGAGGLTMAAGSNDLQAINATNTYLGTTTLASGILSIANVATLGTGSLDFAGGTLQLAATRDTTNGILSNLFVLSSNSIINNTVNAAAGTRNLPFGGGVSTIGGTLTIQNIASANNNIMNLRFTAGGFNFSQPIVFDNSLSGNADDNQVQLDCFNSNGSPAQVFSGTISGDGLLRRAFNIAGGGGTTILTGNNTYAPLSTSLNPNGTVVEQGLVGLGSSTTTDVNSNVLSGPVGTSPMQINDDPFVGFFAYGGPQVIANEIVFTGANTYIVGSNSLTLSGVMDLGTNSSTMLTVSNTALTTISGVLSNTANLTMAGPGVLALTADSTATWSGALSITGGTLLANNSAGSASGSNGVTISGGTLAGTGSIAGAVVATTGGSVSPGNSVGILTLQSGVDLSGGGGLVWNLGANTTNGPGTSFSQLAVTGGTFNMSGSATLNLQFTGSATVPSSTNAFWQSSHSWNIVTLSGGATIAGLNFSSIINGSSAAGTFSTANNASGVTLTFTPGGVVNQPKITGTTFAANQITFSGTNGVASGSYYVVTSTNAALALSNWTVLSTNSFGANGNFTNVISINPSEHRRFYRVEIP